MLEIIKNTEPRELRQYRQTPFASYADMPSDIKKKVMESLLLEQGCLCAYCMCRIDAGNGKHRATIEHRTPQADTSEKERLDYNNMLAVCWGNRDAHFNHDKSCDAKRGSLQPKKQKMKHVDVLRGWTLADIKYKADGTIFSDHPDVDEDINMRLNLNCEARRLKDCRVQALRALHKVINKKYPNKHAPQGYLQDLYKYYTEKRERKDPYCGIIIAWLSRKI